MGISLPGATERPHSFEQIKPGEFSFVLVFQTKVPLFQVPCTGLKVNSKWYRLGPKKPREGIAVGVKSEEGEVGELSSDVLGRRCGIGRADIGRGGWRDSGLSKG